MRLFISILLTGLFLFSANVQAQESGDENSPETSLSAADMKRMADECKSKNFVIKELNLPAATTCAQSCMASDTYFMRTMGGAPPSKEEIARVVTNCKNSHKEVMDMVKKVQGVPPSERLGLIDLTYQDTLDSFHKKCEGYSTAAVCDCATTKVIGDLNGHGHWNLHRSYPRAVGACARAME